MKFALALLFVASALQAKTFEQCGVRFEYPDDWTAKVNPRSVYRRFDLPARCTIGLHPPGWSRYPKNSPFALEAYPVAIRLFDRPFLQVARKAGFLRRSDRYFEGFPDLDYRAPEGWAIMVRQGTLPAHAFHTDCCQAVRGKSWYHSRGKDGVVTSETREAAVLNDRHRHSASID